MLSCKDIKYALGLRVPFVLVWLPFLSSFCVGPCILPFLPNENVVFYNNNKN